VRTSIIIEVINNQNGGLKGIKPIITTGEVNGNKLKNIDILCYHKNDRYTGFPLRYKFSVVELKRDIADDAAVTQVINYSKWVTGRLAGNEIEVVQPILIAFDFNVKAKLKAKNSDFNEKEILFFKYEVKNNNIVFSNVSY
jgi:RecB family endonuclease NucS